MKGGGGEGEGREEKRKEGRGKEHCISQSSLRKQLSQLL